MIMRMKKFWRAITVSEEAANDAGIDAVVRAQLAEDWPMVGPRGGRYVSVGPASEVTVGQLGRDFMTNSITYRVRRMGRYVRPAARYTSGPA